MNYVGKNLSEAVNQCMESKVTYRVLYKDRPHLITADYKEDRVNLVVDENDVIVEMYNG